MPSLGRVSFEGPAVQAALSGYSDLPMRTVARAHGAPYCINEVVLDETVIRPGKLQRAILALPESEHPVGGQLMGSQPKTFGEAASRLVSAGYDVVDINFGCPVPRVLGRRRGGYLLGEPQTAVEIIDRVLAGAGDVPVTVKMRRGIDESSESERSFFEILDAAFERGVAGVTVHGRSVVQRYNGPSDWSFLAKVRRHLGPDLQLWGSGDIFRPRDVFEMIEQTGVDAVTVARGCIGNPWFFAQVQAMLEGDEPKAPDVAAQRRAIELHRDAAIGCYGMAKAVQRLRTHVSKYAGVHPEPTAVRDAFVKIRSFDELDVVLDRHYSVADGHRTSSHLEDLALNAQLLKGCAPGGGVAPARGAAPRRVS